MMTPATAPLIDVLVEVTQADIDGGEPYSGCNCPIARAIKRAFPGQDVAVGSFNNMIGDYFFRLPDAARGFVAAFDSGRPCQPLTFPLAVPEWVANQDVADRSPGHEGAARNMDAAACMMQQE